jgi:ribosomal protein S18 acetylase RimI-like enzyme
MIQLFDLPDALEVGEIQIAPPFQGKGIGTQILHKTIAQARARRKKVSLSTGMKNTRALELYIRLGFRCVGQTETHNRLEFEPEWS